MQSDLSGGGAVDEGGGPRRVDIVTIKLTVIIDQENHLVEWKCMGIGGDPRRVLTQLARQPGPIGVLEPHVELMASALRTLLEEHCEPF